ATFINVATITVGSFLGLWLQQLLTDDMQQIIFQAIGLGTIVIGIQMALKVPEGYMLIFIMSLIIGGLVGELLDLQDFLNGLGDQLKNSLSIGDATFTEGLVTAFLLFCIGSMTLVGAIEEGVQGNRELLLVKSLLDGVSSIALASAYGIGVWFSIFPLLILQGGTTLLAAKIAPFITDNILHQITAIGGVLIIAISIRLIDLGTINIENLLPALVVVVLITWAYDSFQNKWQGRKENLATDD
ncbi:MAG: DUF554 domain-containing protein, partial [Bacteroidota bacterium]